MRIGLGLLQDEFELSGEFQVFRGWEEAVRGAGLQPRRFGPAGARLRADGFSRHPTGEMLLQKAAEQWSFIRAAVRTAAEADLLHLFLPTPSFLWIADRVKKLSRRPVVVSCLAEAPERATAPRGRQLWEAPRFHLLRWLAAVLLPSGGFTCERYLAGSQALADQLKRRGCPERRVSVLPGPLPAEPDPDALSLRLADWLRQRPGFLFIGHFLPSKGVGPLLKALAQVPPPARLLLAWSGLGERPPVDRMIRGLGLGDRVLISEGPVHRSLLCSAALGLVAPFPVSYGQVSPPMVVLEAFRAGVPVLSSPLAGLAGLVEDGRTGWAIDPEDPAALAARMRELMDAPRRAEGMRRAQRAIFARLQSRIDPEALYRSALGAQNG